MLASENIKILNPNQYSATFCNCLDLFAQNKVVQCAMPLLDFLLSDTQILIIIFVTYIMLICIPGPPRAGDSKGTAGLKCRDLTADESRQCRSFNFQPIL